MCVVELQISKTDKRGQYHKIDNNTPLVCPDAAGRCSVENPTTHNPPEREAVEML